MKKPLPIGVDNFEDIVKSRYCYVDKTMFIKELLDLKGKVNLFTRPRRFGKTLNLRLRRITVCSLQFAVITGCLRISKESIFTGLNHLKIISILDQRYGEHFGFTESEVIQIMSYYEVGNRFPTMKEWYDGYRGL